MIDHNTTGPLGQDSDTGDAKDTMSKESVWLHREKAHEANDSSAAGAAQASCDSAAASISKGGKLGTDQAKQLALFTVRLNEQEIASHVRRSGSQRILLAVPVDHSDPS